MAVTPESEWDAPHPSFPGVPAPAAPPNTFAQPAPPPAPAFGATFNPQPGSPQPGQFGQQFGQQYGQPAYTPAQGHSIVPGQTLGQQLPMPQYIPTKGKSKVGLYLGISAVSLSLVVGAAGIGVAKFLSREDSLANAVPSTALGFVEFNQNPSLAQKKELLLLAGKFPTDQSKVLKDPAAAVFDLLKGAGGFTGDYATDIKPWLGDLMAVAVLPASVPTKEPIPVLMFSVSDQDKAEKSLSQITGSPVKCKLSDKNVYCAENEIIIDKAILDAKQNSLASAPRYAQEMKYLGDEGLMNGWVDTAAVFAKTSAGEIYKTAGISPDALGDVSAFVLRAANGAFEFVGSNKGAPAIVGAMKAPIDGLAADSILAIGVGSPDQILTKSWQQLEAAKESDLFKEEIESFEKESGLSLPQDLAAALGPQMSISMGGTANKPAGAVKVSGNPTKVVKVIQSKVPDSKLYTTKTGKTTVIAESPEQAKKYATAGGLANTKLFKDAVPRAGSAQVVLFCDVQRLDTLTGDDSIRSQKWLTSIAAFGMTAERDGDRNRVIARVTFK